MIASPKFLVQPVMRNLWSVIRALTAGLALLTSAALLSLPGFAIGPGDQAPPWTGIDLSSGTQVDFPGVLNGKPAVLVFWATWCPYCKAFMPYAGQIQADYADQGVQIITFNSKERGRGDPAAYVSSLGFPLLAIKDADSIGEAYNIAFIPGLLVVDGTGQVIYRRRSTNLPAGRTVSQQWAAEVRSVLDSALAASQPE